MANEILLWKSANGAPAGRMVGEGRPRSEDVDDPDRVDLTAGGGMTEQRLGL